MLEKLIPYGLRKSTSIVLEMPLKLLLLLRALNPLTWWRLSKKIHQAPVREDSEAGTQDSSKEGMPVADPLRPRPPTESQMGAWHLPDERRLATLTRIHLGQQLMLILFVLIPVLFVLVIWNGWGSKTFSPQLLSFNFFILTFMIMLPTYVRLTVVRRQLELKRLVGLSDLTQRQHWY
ncbi:MAG: hypothetical protein IBX50_15865 [Marinospirillum sp.]|uniref:hypothetical protein n=1 Tax=Marinospirillum sp. TaxID=2183934 RepID=UPI0019DDBECA|nr:hypothetical protein [Marinospirillum sp.]MBE0508166.1 hypothetical protein [Marinospirillum sp.]